MSKLTPDDIVDLGRWHFIQFKDEATAQAAMEKYRHFVEQQRDRADAVTEADLADAPPIGPDFPGADITDADADQPDEGADDRERPAA